MFYGFKFCNANFTVSITTMLEPYKIYIINWLKRVPMEKKIAARIIIIQYCKPNMIGKR